MTLNCFNSQPAHQQPGEDQHTVLLAQECSDKASAALILRPRFEHRSVTPHSVLQLEQGAPDDSLIFAFSNNRSSPPRGYQLCLMCNQYWIFQMVWEDWTRRFHPKVLFRSKYYRLAHNWFQPISHYLIPFFSYYSNYIHVWSEE